MSTVFSYLNLKGASMESIKADFPRIDEPGFQQSSHNMDSVESKPHKNSVEGLPWVSEGVAFPCGTEFRCKYKGYFYYGNVKSGALMLNGKEFLSPSEAAVTITRNPVDGWLLWDCKLPGESSWVNLHTLKQMK